LLHELKRAGTFVKIFETWLFSGETIATVSCFQYTSIIFMHSSD